MLLQPLRQKTNKGKIAQAITLPAPTQGWFVANNLSVAPVGTAYQLENFFPELDSIRLRGGSALWASGMGSSTTVETLMVYNKGGTEKMFACAGSAIYDVTAGGAVGAGAVTGLSNARWQWTMMTTSGGSYLSCVNGADTPRLYDSVGGWATTPAITGVTAADLINVWTYRNRLYYVEKNSSNCWYLSSDAIGGAATVFSLGGVFKRGGFLVSGGSWSVATNGGLEENCAFISSEGEVAIYRGTYPGDTAWSLVGVYQIGKPLGYRCTWKAGGDLAVLCEDGIIPLSQAVNYDQSALINTAITKNIAPEWRRIVDGRQDATGWQMLSWPFRQMFIVNIPKLSTATSYQFISNIVSGAWCRYTGLDAACWAIFNNRLFYGSKVGTVVEAETGAADQGSSYTATCFWSYSNLKQPAQYKAMLMGRLNAGSSFPVTASQLYVRTDFDFSTKSPPTSSPAPTAGAVWDTAVWDVDAWPSVTATPVSTWRGLSGLGTMIAPVYQITVSTTEDVDLRLYSLDLTFEQGETFG